MRLFVRWRGAITPRNLAPLSLCHEENNFVLSVSVSAPVLHELREDKLRKTKRVGLYGSANQGIRERVLIKITNAQNVRDLTSYRPIPALLLSLDQSTREGLINVSSRWQRMMFYCYCSSIFHVRCIFFCSINRLIICGFY